MKFFRQLIHTGVTEDLLEEIQQKVVLTNKVAAFLLFIEIACIPLAIGSSATMGITAAMIVILTLIFLLNRAGLTSVARGILSMLMVSCITVTHGIISAPGTDPHPGIIALDMAAFSLPFVLFHFTEKKAIISIVILNFLQFQSLPYVSLWLYDERTAKIQEQESNFGYLLTLCYLLLVGSLYLLVNSQRSTDKKRLATLAEFEKNKLEMEATQAKFKKTLEEVEKAHAEDEKRSWAASGQARFSEMLRNSHNLHEVYDELISGIVKYLDANQAALFELNKNNQERYLELVTCYAYNRKKHIGRRVEIGQGLVGQAFLEGETLLLSEIPEGYINITSGLGESTPGFLIILPLKINEETAGVLEMASFKPLEKYQIQFLEKLGESIASAILNHNVSAQTNRLLEQTKIQSEEMKAQEEEMRQNMEELHATQEQMSRQVKESDELKEALQVRERVIGIKTILSESDLFGTILHANDKLCEVSKYSREELIGKPHNIFRHPDMPGELFKIFWQTIKSGRTFNAIIKNKAKDGTHYWVDATIVPVKDEDGKIIKYVGARYHLTDDSIAEKMYAQQLKTLQLQSVSV